MALRGYKLDYGWVVGVPDGWRAEKKERGSYIFYPGDPEDETTIYAAALHSEGHDHEITPERVMKEAFEKSIPQGAQELEIMTGIHSKAFFLNDAANGVYRIGAGFFTDGELLSLNVYAKSEEKAKEASAGFSKVKLVRGDKNAV